MSFEKTIAQVEAWADEVGLNFPYNDSAGWHEWTDERRHNWIASKLISMHHWQALEEYLAQRGDK